MRKEFLGKLFKKLSPAPVTSGVCVDVNKTKTPLLMEDFDRESRKIEYGYTNSKFSSP